jgi:hypothetical protein
MDWRRLEITTGYLSKYSFEQTDYIVCAQFAALETQDVWRRWEDTMRKLLIVLSVTIISSCALAKDPVFYQTGRITQMTSINCGYTENSGKSVLGEIVGTDGAHVKNKELLCQDYVLKTDKVLYHIRPKDEKHPMLLPVGEEAQFRIKKDHMVLVVPEIKAKETDYIVVSMTQIQPDTAHSEKMEVSQTTK